MRILASENGMDLDDFLLPLQRIEIVSNSDQVYFRRELVGRVSPVAVGEDAETSLSKLFYLFLNFGEVRRGVLVVA